MPEGVKQFIQQADPLPHLGVLLGKTSVQVVFTYEYLEW